MLIKPLVAMISFSIAYGTLILQILYESEKGHNIIFKNQEEVGIIVKFIPYEKLSKKGSDTTAAGGGFREWSEWQRSARCKSASPDAASAGHRNRD
jgi:hypothetical protein